MSASPSSSSSADLSQKADEAAALRPRFTELRAVPLKFRLGSFTAEVLGWGFIDSAKWWRNYLHAHTFYEICYAFSGSGLFRIHGTDYTVQSGDVFIAKPREEHEIISSKEDPLGIYFWSYTLVPDAPSASSRLRPYPAGHATPDPDQPATVPQEPLNGLLHAFVNSQRYVSARVPGMERTCELLTEEIVRHEPGYVGLIEGLVRKLLLDTARAALGEARPGEAVTPAARDSAEAFTSQATRYMRDNLGRNLSIREIAAQVNLSERHFARIFHQETGKSPLDFLTGIRIETAAQLLLDRAIPIKEIAERIGYPDVRYFTTVFRRHTGLPPAAYRERGGTTFQDPALDRRWRRNQASRSKGSKPKSVGRKIK